MPTPKSPTATEELHQNQLGTSEAVAGLGLYATQLLRQDGVVSFYIDSNGFVLAAKPGELELDSVPEEMALQILSEERNYTDEELEIYLRGRDARLTRRNG